MRRPKSLKNFKFTLPVIIGIIFAVALIISYFIPVLVNGGANYNYNTYAPLLALIIFYNPFILGIYILVIIILIYQGLGKKH